VRYILITFFLFFTFNINSYAETSSYKKLYKAARQLEQAGDIKQALIKYEQAFQLSQASAPKKAAAIAFWLGQLHSQQTNLPQAFHYHQRALTLRQQHFGIQHNAVAVSLNAVAGLYFKKNDFLQAQQHYQQALTIIEKNRGAKHRQTAIYLNNLAEVARELGDYTQAQKLLLRALEIDTQHYGEQHPRHAIRLNNLAEVYRLQGHYKQAKNLLDKAVEIDSTAVKKQENDPLNLAIRFNNLGQFYRTIGAYEKAIEAYQQALAGFEKHAGIHDPRTAVIYNNLAWVYQLTVQTQKAENYYNRALANAEKNYSTPHTDTARYLNNLALLYVEQEKFTQAEKYYQRALKIWRHIYSDFHPNIASTLHNLAKLYRVLGNYPEAEKRLQQALVIAQSAGQPELLWAIQDNYSHLFAQQQQYHAAIFFAKQAVNTLQKLRINVAQMDKELQRLFLHSKMPVYRHLTNLLINQGRLSEAQQVMMMIKEEEYFDFIRRGQPSNVRTLTAGFTSQEQLWVKRVEKIYQRLLSIGEQLRHLENKFTLSNSEKQQQQQLYQELSAAQAAFNFYIKTLKKSLQTDTAWGKNQVIETICQKEGDSVATPPPAKTKRSYDKNVKALQKVLETLGHDVVLVQYFIGDDKLRMILTTATRQFCRESLISRQDLNQQISRFRQAMQILRKRPHRVAYQLYQLVFAPIAEDIEKAGGKMLMFSLDGQLRYIPMAALYDGKQYLVEKYAMTMFTEAARDKIRDLPPTVWHLAGLGLTRALHNFNPLPAVETELDNIIRQDEADASGLLSGDIYLNDAFTAQQLQQSLQSTYSVLHVASHFVFQTGTDEDSYLLLGDGNLLTLADIKQGYNFGSLDLLTLSACQTGVGARANGREIEGFAALAQKQGAKSVIATLWSVNDEGTGDFMQYFYKIHTEEAGLTKAQAMRRAQLAFIYAGRKKTLQKGTKLYPRYYTHPYYWAPFILMGNWL